MYQLDIVIVMLTISLPLFLHAAVGNAVNNFIIFIGIIVFNYFTFIVPPFRFCRFSLHRVCQGDSHLVYYMLTVLNVCTFYLATVSRLLLFTLL